MSYYEGKVCLNGIVSLFWGARFITAKGLLCHMMTVSYSELNVYSIICFILCRKYVMFEWLFVHIYSIYLTKMRLIRSVSSFLVYESMTGLCIKKIHKMTILVLYIHIQYIHIHLYILFIDKIFLIKLSLNFYFYTEDKTELNQIRTTRKSKAEKQQQACRLNQ